MNRQFALLLVVLLVGAGLFVLVKRPFADSSRTGGRTANRELSEPHPAKTPRGDHHVRTPQEARAGVRAFLDSEAPGSYRFQEITAMVRKLDDGQLHDLATEIGFAEAGGAVGWVRAALFEEWARRDFAEAMEFVAGNGGDDSCYQQALYGAFHGSRPDDPRAAFHHLGRMHSDFGSATGPFSWQWSQYALREVFAEIARQDPATAWSIMAGTDLTPEDAAAIKTLDRKFRGPLQQQGFADVAMQGVFMGLPDKNTALNFAKSFEDRWNSPEVVAKLNRYFADVSRSSFNAPPPEEFIGGSIALALARFDLDAAEHWAATKGPRPDRSGESRAGGLWMDWGQQNPGEALGILRSGERPEWHKTLVTAAIRGDARLAPEIMAQFHGQEWAARALEYTFPLNGSFKEVDYFPASPKDPILPDHHERYRVLGDAIAAGDFPPEVAQRLRQSLNRSFQSSVPTAREAFGDP